MKCYSDGLYVTQSDSLETECVAIVVKATGESFESSTSLSVVKSVQNVITGLVDRLLNSQYETDLISKYLSDNNIQAMSYHSGIPSKDRSCIQESFCSNKIRVVRNCSGSLWL
ncbi:unnamed protein product [Camellia sinensis]